MDFLKAKCNNLVHLCDNGCVSFWKHCSGFEADDNGVHMRSGVMTTLQLNGVKIATKDQIQGSVSKYHQDVFVNYVHKRI